jgi:dephospho-CoA kinase
METKKHDFDIVVGVTGLLAAGKDVLIDRLKEVEGYGVARTSDPIRMDWANKGVANPTREQLQDLGNQGRQNGLGYWALRTAGMLGEQGHRRIAVNGLRHPGEAEALQSIYGDKFILFGVTAPTVVRFNRVASRQRVGDSFTLEGFLAMDDRDRGINEPPDGQQVDRTLSCVKPENLYCNNGTLEEYYEWIASAMARLKVPA